jgi:hypothetical protein
VFRRQEKDGLTAKSRRNGNPLLLGFGHVSDPCAMNAARSTSVAKGE